MTPISNLLRKQNVIIARCERCGRRGQIQIKVDRMAELEFWHCRVCGQTARYKIGERRHG